MSKLNMCTRLVDRNHKINIDQNEVCSQYEVDYYECVYECERTPNTFLRHFKCKNKTE